MKTTEQMTETMFRKIYIDKTYRPLSVNEINRAKAKRESKRMSFIVSFIIVAFAGSLTVLSACIGTIN